MDNDNDSMGGTLLDFFLQKDEKCYFFDNFGGQFDKFSLQQLSKPISYLEKKSKMKKLAYAAHLVHIFPI